MVSKNVLILFSLKGTQQCIFLAACGAQSSLLFRPVLVLKELAFYLRNTVSIKLHGKLLEAHGRESTQPCCCEGNVMKNNSNDNFSI